MAHDSRPESIIGLLSSLGMEAWELHRCSEPAATCPLRTQTAPDDGSRTIRGCLDIRQLDDAVQVLSKCASRSDDMQALRGVVNDSTFPLSRATDYQVIDLAARMIARRELCVVAVRIVPSGPV